MTAEGAMMPKQTGLRLLASPDSTEFCVIIGLHAPMPPYFFTDITGDEEMLSMEVSGGSNGDATAIVRAEDLMTTLADLMGLGVLLDVASRYMQDVTRTLARRAEGTDVDLDSERVGA